MNTKNKKKKKKKKKKKEEEEENRRRRRKKKVEQKDQEEQEQEQNHKHKYPSTCKQLLQPRISSPILYPSATLATWPLPGTRNSPPQRSASVMATADISEATFAPSNHGRSKRRQTFIKASKMQAINLSNI